MYKQSGGQTSIFDDPWNFMGYHLFCRCTYCQIVLRERDQ